MILTGPFQLLAYRNGVVDRVETEQLACRMRYIFFNQPTHGSLNRKLKNCSTCWSRWILSGELHWRRVCGAEGDDFTKKVEAALALLPAGLAPSLSHAPVGVPAAASSSSQAMADLASVIRWREQGLLSEDEFRAAKRTLGLH